MPEFLHLTSPREALDRLLIYLNPLSLTEVVDIHHALGRVTAAPILAPHALPSFSRSSVDGYAVQAADTFGAGESLPAYLQIIGEVPMGSSPDFHIRQGTCAIIHTGGMLPKGADAVIMLENTQQVNQQEVEIMRAVAIGENTIQVGEDVTPGQEVISKSRFLRPAEIGGLAALGIDQIRVSVKPRVAIISTGDEIIPIHEPLTPGKVHDVNTYTLSGLVERAGGEAIALGIIPDQAEILELKASEALRTCDMVVITAGSSASARDLTAEIVNRLGKPGVLIHGVNIRPGKPTILAVCALAGQPPKAIIGLPGNPVSAYVIAGLFVVPVIKFLLGLPLNTAKPSIKARLTLNVPSVAGREDWIPVKLSQNQSNWEAEPVFGKSNLIFTLARADGMVCISPEVTGLNSGEIVEVFLLE